MIEISVNTGQMIRVNKYVSRKTKTNRKEEKQRIKRNRKKKKQGV